MKSTRILVVVSALFLTITSLSADKSQLFKQHGQVGDVFSGNISASQGLKLAKVRELTTRFEMRVSPDLSAVNIVVSVDSQQLESILSRGGDIEVRLYAGPRGSERRLQERTYTLTQAKQSFTLPYRDVCPEAGPTSVKVRASVRGTERSYTDGEASESFVCSGGEDSGGHGHHHGKENLRSHVDFTMGSGQVNAVISVDPRQFDKVGSRGGYLEVRLYAGERKGQERRLESRTYEMRSSRASYTFPPRDVCDQDSLYSYDRYLKVWVSARDSRGKPMPGFNSSEGARVHVVCGGLVWRTWDLLEELLEE